MPPNIPTTADRYICQGFNVKLCTRQPLKEDNNDNIAVTSSESPMKIFLYSNILLTKLSKNI